MSNIDKIRIHNFKAFYTGTEPDQIDLDGKHLLMYGENGSGKSSIYWALYTLFQSETKTADEIAKYFTPTHDEQLLNFNYLNQRPDFLIDGEGKITNPTDIGKNAEIEVLLQDNTSLKIDKDGYHESIPNKIRALHRHSDFITHRLLVNFYNFRNSKEINLWEVFVRDFFPFLPVNKGNGNETLWQKLVEIESNPPFNVNDANGTFKRSRSKSWQTKIKKEIDKFNEDVAYWIGRINTIANEVYRNELRINDNIEIFLKYKDPLRYDHYKDHVIERNGKKYVRGTGYADFNDPELILNIRRKNSDGTYSLIHRPQAYLNEAKITQIALSIRFSLLHETIKPDYPGQFLALDDLLISLDMSNRDIVLDAILDVYAKRYRIYLFTHERAFFNMAKRRIEYHNNPNEWNFREIYNLKTKNSNAFSPKEFPSKSFLAQANSHKNSFPPDFPAAINYLRKELEEILTTYLPKEIFKNQDGSTKPKLNDHLLAAIKLYDNLGLNSNLIKDIYEFVYLLLNPLSHRDLDSELYKIDIEKIIVIIINLREELSTYSSKIEKILHRDQELILSINVNATTLNEFIFKIEEDVFIFKNDNGTKTISTTSIHKDCNCYEIVSGVKGNDNPITLNKSQRLSITEFYLKCCQISKTHANAPFETLVRRIDNNKTIETVINEIN